MLGCEVAAGAFLAACLLGAAVPAGAPQTLEELDAFYPAVPDAANAALLYLKAADLRKMGEFDPELPMIGTGKPLPIPAVPLAPKIKAGLVAELEDNAGAMLLLHQAAAMDNCRYPIDLTRGAGVHLEHLARVRDLARMLYVQAVVAADDGRAELAVQSLLDGMALARSLRREPVLVSQLVRIACWGIAIDALEQVVNRVPLDGPMLSALQSAVARADDREAMTRAYQGELCTWLDADIETPEERAARMAEREAEVRRLGVDPGMSMMPGGDQSDGDGDIGAPQEIAPGPAPARNSCKHLLTLEEQQQAVQAVTRLVEQSSGSYVEFMRQTMGLTGLLRPGPPMQPGVGAFQLAQVPRTLRGAAGLAARAAAAQGALAVARFRVAQDRLPQEWQELVPDYVSVNLRDPFTDDHAPLYRVTGERYIVYSVGPNQKDDGGIAGEGGAKRDYVFRVERPAQKEGKK